jgi:hypothetical protein
MYKAFLFSETSSFEWLMQKYTPFSKEKIYSFWETIPDEGGILVLYQTNAAIFTINVLFHCAFLDSNKRKVFLLPNDLFIQIDYYLSKVLKLNTQQLAHFGIDIPIPSNKPLEQIVLENPPTTIFIAFGDLEPNETNTAAEQKLCGQTFRFQEEILSISAKHSRQIAQLCVYEVNNKLIIESKPPHNIDLIDIMTSRYQNTIEGYYGPLNKLILSQPSAWLGWQHLSKYVNTIHRPTQNPLPEGTIDQSALFSHTRLKKTIVINSVGKGILLDATFWKKLRKVQTINEIQKAIPSFGKIDLNERKALINFLLNR